MIKQKFFEFWNCDTLDNEMQFSFTNATKNGDFISRTQLIESPDPRYHQEHETNPKIFKNSMAHAFTSGSFRVTQWWSDEDNITESDLDEFEALIKTQINCEVVRDLENKKLIINYTYDGTDPNNDTWSEPSFNYLLNVGKAEIKITQDNSDIACVVRVDKNDAAWKVRQKDIPANATVAIDKPDCELCYTVFTKEVYIGDTKFDKWTTKKQTTSSIDVTNKNDVAVKVLQYYK